MSRTNSSVGTNKGREREKERKEKTEVCGKVSSSSEAGEDEPVMLDTVKGVTADITVSSK
jgi:hypothetical protein